ncbi:MAG: ArsC family [Thermoplasmata archaeon]|jgi:arsenate reductase-like glutaredoxin family protein|nr:ArsC family [Thermoplasmata archaeon]
MAVTFWGRRGDPETLDALAFLRQQRYGADRVLDLDRTPPTAAEMELLRKGLGDLRAAVDPKHPDAAAPPDEALPAWLAADPRRIRSPLLLTPKGALAGFREQKWRAFLDIGKGRS